MKKELSVKLIAKISAFSVTNKPAPVRLTPFNSSPLTPLPRILKFSAFPEGTWLVR